MNLLFTIFGILGFIGTISIIGLLIAPKVLKAVRRWSLRAQRKRFEKEALKDKYKKVKEPFMFSQDWYQETHN